MRLTDVHFEYHRATPVIRGITAQLPQGGICALIGPNAAGKSTLLKLMLGQFDPRQGSITLDGRPVASMPPHERAARMAHVPQRPRSDVPFTIEEVVALGRFALRPDDAAIEEALRLCDLIDIRHRNFAELSTGQQQRVAVARAVAQMAGEGQVSGGARASASASTSTSTSTSNSSAAATTVRGRFMLLDEPVSAMDLLHVHRTMQVLTQLAAGGMGILIVLHDLNLASTYADTVWLMDEGMLVAQGSWDQVLTPAVLEPVYRVVLREQVTGRGRPLFFAEPSATLSL